MKRDNHTGPIMFTSQKIQVNEINKMNNSFYKCGERALLPRKVKNQIIYL